MDKTKELDCKEWCKWFPRLIVAQQRIQKDIADTKDEFKDYKGDLATLLSNVSVYQNKVSELAKQIEKDYEDGKLEYIVISVNSDTHHINKLYSSSQNKR